MTDRTQATAAPHIWSMLALAVIPPAGHACRGRDPGRTRRGDRSLDFSRSSPQLSLAPRPILPTRYGWRRHGGRDITMPRVDFKRVKFDKRFKRASA